MLSLRLAPETERRLSLLARRTGRTKSYYAREIIEEHLEDLEDRYLAERSLEEGGANLTSAQMRNYRIICELQDKRLVVLVVAMGHRSTVYDT